MNIKAILNPSLIQNSIFDENIDFPVQMILLGSLYGAIYRICPILFDDITLYYIVNLFILPKK